VRTGKVANSSRTMLRGAMQAERNDGPTMSRSGPRTRSQLPRKLSPIQKAELENEFGVDVRSEKENMRSRDGRVIVCARRQQCGDQPRRFRCRSSVARRVVDQEYRPVFQSSS